MNHSAADFDVAEISATLSAHGILTLEGRVPEGFKTGLEAWRPGSGVTQLGSTGQASGVAGGALGGIDFSAGFQRAVGVTNFNATDFLDALRHRFFGVDCTGSRLVAGVTK